MVLGKVRALAVYFDSLNENNLPVFSGGDLVSGRVVVEVTGDVRVKSLDITARGVAKVRWTESRNAGANTAYTQNYTEEVEYLHHYDTLIGEERVVSEIKSDKCLRESCRSTWSSLLLEYNTLPHPAPRSCHTPHGC
uniref:Arrestin-like N-terminal domain-containing protein n=1 Tax=Amphiprion ocellaris TaxID=80972 RepID=A0AAQ5X5V3_AMPOC